MAEKCAALKGYAHEGEKYEQIGLSIADELHIPHVRLRARMIQLGHIYAKGALNYVGKFKIQPYSFDSDKDAEGRIRPNPYIAIANQQMREI